MLKRLLFVFVTGLLFSSAAFAQEFNTSSITEYNNRVNEDIGKGTLYTHQVILNSFSKPFAGYNNYKETANFYFTMEEGAIQLKKIIVTSNIAERTAYIDYLFDAQGNVTCYNYNPNVVDPSAKIVRCYFLNKQLKNVYRNEETILEAQFTTEDVRTGVDAMTNAGKYQKIFNSLIAVQLGQ